MEKFPELDEMIHIDVPEYLAETDKLNIRVQRKLQVEEYKITNEYRKDIYDFYDFLKSKIDENQKLFTIHFENDLYYSARDDVIKICDEMIADYDNPNYVYNIFKIVLYYYQIEHECGYLWNQDFTQHLDSLMYYVDKIKQYVAISIIEKRYIDLQFSINISHPNIPLIGEIDIVTEKEIIDVKFTNSFTSKHVYQLLLYYNNICPAWNIKKDLVVYNFKLGKKYIIHINENIFNYHILQWFSMTTDKRIKNIALCHNESNNSDYYIEYNLGFVICCPDKIKTFLSYCDNPTIITYDRYDTNNNNQDNRHNTYDTYNRNCKIVDSKYLIRMLYLEKDTITMSFTDTYNLIFNNDIANVNDNNNTDNSNDSNDSNDGDNDPIHTIKMLIDLLKKLKYNIVIV
jgi:hypothetical protein